jgi:hypothetical protein
MAIVESCMDDLNYRSQTSAQEYLDRSREHYLGVSAAGLLPDGPMLLDQHGCRPISGSQLASNSKPNRTSANHLNALNMSMSSSR